MKSTTAVSLTRRYLPRKMILQLCILFSLMAGACAPSPIPTPTPISVPTIVPGRLCNLTTGETIPLAVTGVSGTGIIYSWSASAGIVIPPNGPTVSYTAPSMAGDVIISVAAQKDDQTSNGILICKVIAPAMTSTPTAIPVTNTPLSTPTSAPPPIACNHPSITKNVFQQLELVDNQFPFYGLENDTNFLCQGVYDTFHTGPMAVKLEYKNVGKNYGFWGIETRNGYNASEFSEICFWVYTENPNQSFRLKLKDMFGTEKGVLIIAEQEKQWTKSCVKLSKFSEQDVLLDKIENVNLGFEQPSGSATVWVDDFEFR